MIFLWNSSGPIRCRIDDCEKTLIDLRYPQLLSACPSDPPSRLRLRHIPVPLTCGVFDKAIITDPSLLEEELLETQITVVSTAAGQVVVVI